MSGLGAGTLSLQRQQYPDPFLDIASTKLPKSRKKLLELCYQFSKTHPQIKPIVQKLARYPITRVILNSENNQESLEEEWREDLENVVGVYEVAEGVGLDYFGYGNCFIIVHRPFLRFYACQSCGKEYQAGKLKYQIINKMIEGQCTECKGTRKFKARDSMIDKLEDIEVVRLKPQNMFVRRNELTGKDWFFYNVPESLTKAVSDGRKPDRQYIDTTPWVYVEAALNKKQIKFAQGRVLHLKIPSISGRDMEWGDPIILAALKDAYLNQVYKKADESAANERSLPARFVFPQATSQDPLAKISLSKFTRFLTFSLKNWRQDKNAIMPVPFPVGVSEVGGDAQRFNTANLRQLQIKEIIGSTGVPEGFLSEGMTWSGASVQLRMLENTLLTYSRGLDKLLHFIIKEVCLITKKPKVKAKFKPFRMADDVQMLQILMNLAQLKQVSYKEILDRIDLDWEKQHERILEETKKVQRITMEEALLQARVALRSVGAEVEAQSYQEGFSALKENIHQDMESAEQHLKGEGEFNELDEQAEQQQQEASQQQGEVEQRQMEAATRSEEAKASKDESIANQKGVHADIAQNSQEDSSTTPVVKAYADSVLQMKTPEEQEQAMVQIETQYARLGAKVRARVEEVQERSNIPQRVQAAEEERSSEQEEIQAAVDKLRADSKNAKEMAEGMLMLDPKVREPAMEYLKTSDPQLAARVIMELGPGGSNGGGRGGNVVDMRPMPDQLPPRRK
jgi:hypothetical protein